MEVGIYKLGVAKLQVQVVEIEIASFQVEIASFEVRLQVLKLKFHKLKFSCCARQQPAQFCETVPVDVLFFDFCLFFVFLFLIYYFFGMMIGEA